MSQIKTTRAGHKNPSAGELVRCFDCDELGKRGGMMLVRRYPYSDKTLDLIVFVHRKHGR